MSAARFGQEPDRVNVPIAIAVAAAALALFGVAVLAAYGIQVARTREALGDAAVAIPRGARASEQALIFRVHYDVEEPRKQREAQRRLLESAGWVDEARGRVHLPIARAMELVAEGRYPTAAPADEAAPADGAAPSPSNPSDGGATP